MNCPYHQLNEHDIEPAGTAANPTDKADVYGELGVELHHDPKGGHR